MTDYEILMVFLGIISVLIAFLDKRKYAKKCSTCRQTG